MKKVLSHLKGYALESVLAPLFKLLEAGFELIVPFVIAAIIDKGIPGGDASYIIKMGLILVGLGLVGLASSVTAQYFAAKAAVGVAAMRSSPKFSVSATTIWIALARPHWLRA